jgi:hypothetical protein
MESARAFGIRGEDDDLGDPPRGTFTFTRLAVAVPPLGTLRCCAFRPNTLVVVDAADDEPIDLDDAAVDEMGSRPAMTPRVATAVDLPAAAAEEVDVTAVRAAPRAKAADSFEVLLL